MMPLVDCHCHLEDKRFDEDREQVIQRNKQLVNFVVNSGVDLAGNNATLELHNNHSRFIHASLGLAPTIASEITDKELETIFDLILVNKNNIVAVGEVGLDYHWISDPKSRVRQQEVFKQFISLADELDKPLVIHCRKAMDDLLNILGKHSPSKVMMHHFDGNANQLQTCVDHGFHISLCTGFRDKRLINQLPLEYCLVETDSPFNCPTRGKRNEPFFVRDIVALVSTVKEVDANDYIFENALRFFGVSTRTL